MEDQIQRLKSRLDQDEPRWFYDWATGQELHEFARVHEGSMATTNLRNAVAYRLFHRILNAAICEGLVEEVQ